MKKTLVSALSAALAIGTASVTFAAANPFEDVPADHWAYDAVAQLAKDGVIEGYGDGTYVGDAAITRYEMAQMVARAMTKSDVKHADKVALDKLAAEFADELNSLGVRVSNLEKKVDNVKFYGQLRYQFRNARTEGSPKHGSLNKILLRLQADAEVNKNWTAKSRIIYETNMKDAKNTTGDKVVFNRAYLQGDYKNLQIKLGKFDYWTSFDEGMIFDDDLAGASVEFGKTIKAKLMAGRYNNKSTLNEYSNDPDKVIDLQAIEIYSDSKKFTWTANYFNVQNKKTFKDTWNQKKNMGIWEVGLGYHFNNDWYLRGAYAENSSAKSGDTVTYGEKGSKKAYFAQLNFKNANRKKPGTWGIHVGYRHLGALATIMPTYFEIFQDQKGIIAGFDYTLVQNVVMSFKYLDGKQISGKDPKKVRTIFTQVEARF